MKERINECFEALKELDIKPTPHNVSILAGVYDNLRSVYAELKKEKEGEKVASDSELKEGEKVASDTE